MGLTAQASVTTVSRAHHICVIKMLVKYVLPGKQFFPNKSYFPVLNCAKSLGMLGGEGGLLLRRHLPHNACTIPDFRLAVFGDRISVGFSLRGSFRLASAHSS